MTDYSGVPVADIIEQIVAWHATLGEDRTRVQNIAWRIAKAADSPAARDGVQFANLANDRIDRIRGELDRLRKELPLGVTAGHVEAARQLFSSAQELEESAVRFKRTWHLDMWTSEGDEIPIMADLYQVVRQAAVDLFDVSNVAHRLGALEWPANPVAALEVVEVRPNFYGVGINLRALWGRIFRRSPDSWS